MRGGALSSLFISRYLSCPHALLSPSHRRCLHRNHSSCIKSLDFRAKSLGAKFPVIIRAYHRQNSNQKLCLSGSRQELVHPSQPRPVIGWPLQCVP